MHTHQHQLFTIVAKNDNNILVMVPALIFDTPDDIRRL